MPPEGWETKKLVDVCQLINGRAYKESELLPCGKYPVLRVGNFFTNNNWYYSDLELPADKYCDLNDLLYAWSASFGPRIWLGGKVIFHYHIWKVEPYPFIEKEYLYYFLEQDVTAIKAAQGNGSTMMHVTKEAMENRLICLPPISEQKRIAKILSEMDEAIEATKSVIEQAKKAKHGLLQTLLTRGINHTKFKPSTLGEIPENWAVKKIMEVCKLINGRAYKENELLDAGKYPVLRVGNFFTNDNWHYSDLELPDDKYCNKHDLLYAWSASFGPRIWWGDKVIYHYHIWKVEPFREEIEKSYLFYLFEWDVTQIKAAHGTGSTMMHVTKGAMENRPIALPPLPEQRKVVEILEGVDKQLKTENAKLASFEQLKRGLMEDLLTGKVQVPAECPALNLVHNTEVTAPPRKEVQPAFKRAVLAAEITHQLYLNPKFGSVKQEKILDLCERHLDLDAELGRTAYRQAAGPYDNKAKRSIEANFKNHKWFDVQRPKGQGVKYLPLEKCGQHKSYFNRYFGQISAEIQAIIDLLKGMKTEQCEIVATLYAAWNDFLLKGKTPDDEAIVSDVLNNWHDNKRQISKDRWLSALPWMRDNNLVPHGSGRQTKSTKS